eukprot:scaffold23068_cov70-Phaeocystis_antarctica.AAC.8
MGWLAWSVAVGMSWFVCRWGTGRDGSDRPRRGAALVAPLCVHRVESGQAVQRRAGARPCRSEPVHQLGPHRS